jgi:peroxiredoxin Q/BCP
MTTRPDVGDTVPDIALETPDGGTVKPSDFRGRKLVLFFYPKDDTPGCTIENKDFSALAGDFAKADVALLGVSKDPPKKHQKFAAKYGLVAPLASDPGSTAWQTPLASGLKRACTGAATWAWSARLTSSIPTARSPRSGAR